MPYKDPILVRLSMTVRSIISRCYNPDHPQYYHYGGRGIKVWHGWLTNRKAFVEYLRQLPGSNDRRLMIDRIDNDRDYEPGNIRYVTSTQSNSNRRSNRYLTYNGLTMTAKEWSRRLNINYTTVIQRMDNGWTTEAILTTPINIRRKGHDRTRMSTENDSPRDSETG